MDNPQNLSAQCQQYSTRGWWRRLVIRVVLSVVVLALSLIILRHLLVNMVSPGQPYDEWPPPTSKAPADRWGR